MHQNVQGRQVSDQLADAAMENLRREKNNAKLQ
jgi:hypothetical protein